jgi:hypothetical protein
LQKLKGWSVSLSILGDAPVQGIVPSTGQRFCVVPYPARASLVDRNEHDKVRESRLNRCSPRSICESIRVKLSRWSFSIRQSEVEVLSAGTRPILWYKACINTLENLEAHGIPLGKNAGVKLKEKRHRATLERMPNDMTIWVTDGFYEWENPKWRKSFVRSDWNL